MYKWSEKSHDYIQHKYYVKDQLYDTCSLDCNVDLETYCEGKQQELNLQSDKEN